MIQVLRAQWYGSTYEVTVWMTPPETVYRIILRDNATGSVIASQDVHCTDPGYAQFENLEDELRSRLVIDIEVEICVNDERTGGIDRRTVLTGFQDPNMPLDCRGVVQDLGPTIACRESISRAHTALINAQNACTHQADVCDEARTADLERQGAVFLAMSALLAVAGLFLSALPFGQTGGIVLLVAAAAVLALATGFLIAASARRQACLDASGEVNAVNRRLGVALRNLNYGNLCCPTWIPLELRDVMLRPCAPVPHPRT